MSNTTLMQISKFKEMLKDPKVNFDMLSVEIDKAVEHLTHQERLHLLSELDEDKEPENGGFDLDEEDEQNNTQLLNERKYEELAQPIASFDEHRYFQEHSIDKSDTFGEQRHVEACQEVERAAAFVKVLLTMNSTEDLSLSLANDCFSYIQEQYEECFKGVRFFREVEQLRVKFREDWDLKFLNFIKSRIWTLLKENGLISKPWDLAKSSETYSQILVRIYPELYHFAGEVIRKTVNSPLCHCLGF